MSEDPRSAERRDRGSGTGPAIAVRGLTKSFEEGRIPALRGVELEIGAGEFVAITGPSGCGKSTLLHLIAALDRPDGGSIVVAGRDLTGIGDLSRYRAREIGLVFQLHNLLPTLSASENVQVPMFEIGRSAGARRRRAEELLEMVDLADRLTNRPAELSGGERQRVAIARALANDPPILLADEPTGNLDTKAGARVLDLLDRLRFERRLTIVLVSHDAAVAARADRIAYMVDGRMATDREARQRFAVSAAAAPAT